MSEPELLNITIIRAKTNLDALHRIAARYEFEANLDPVRLSPWECVHRFGKNILYWLLTLAHAIPTALSQIHSGEVGS